MKTFKDLTEKKSNMDTVTIKCRDREGVIKKLIELCGEWGNVGHSFTVEVQSDSNGKKSFGWDGDGGAYIESVEHTKSE